jgi:hypothetical protein
MKVHNHIPLLIECLTRWETCPDENQFLTEYARPLRATMGDFFDDFHDVLTDLNWNEYRAHALTLNPEHEAKRFERNLALVENLFGFKLGGEVFLIGTFQNMDGFARFERGEHKVYLGLDESHLDGRYLDVLTTHELTHVARESRPEVWQGFGLDPKMSRADFLEYQPVIEHVLGEGFSCVVSEILVPGEPVWKYTYQSEKSLEQVKRKSKEIDRLIKNEITHADGDYGKLYGIRPLFSQYVWGAEWVKTLLVKYANGDPKKLVTMCAKDFIQDSLEFTLFSSHH